MKPIDPVLEKTLASELDEPATLVHEADGTRSETPCATLRAAAELALRLPRRAGEAHWVVSVTGEILTLDQLTDVADRFRA